MKKLVIASAVAAVMSSSAVIADTSVYGNMRLQMTNQAVMAMDSTKLVLGVKTSEDLGNGMTAYAQLELEHDDADQRGAGLGWRNDLSFVGIKGDFGAVQLGVQNDAAGFACGATDIFIYNSGAVCGVGAVNDELDDAVAYVGAFGDVTFVAGMTFGGNHAVDDSDVNHSIVALNYAAGDLQVGAQSTSFDGGDTVYVLGGSYTVSNFKIGLTIGNDSNDSATAITVQMPVAGGNLAVGIDSGEDAGVADTTNLEFDKALGKTAYWGAQYSSVDGVDDDLISVYIGKKW